MISDNDNALESAEKNLKDIKDNLESGVKPVTASDISNTESSVLGVSLKRASESIERVSNTLHPLSGKIKKGGK